jgi:hypothetical protein
MGVKMARRFLGLILATALAASATAQELATFPSLKFGPLTVGGSIAQAQAETPNATWSVLGIAPSGAPTHAVAPAAFAFAGFSVDASVTSQRYASSLSLIHRMPGPVTSQSCFSAALVWMRAVRDIVGPLRAQPPYNVTTPKTTQFLTQRIEGNLIIMPLSSGGGTKTFGELVEFAPGETALLDGLRNTAPHPLAKWARKPPTAFTFTATNGIATDAASRSVNVDSSFETAGNQPTGACSHRVEIAQGDKPPPPTMYAFSPEKVIAGPSIAQRHGAAASLGAELTAPIALTALCKVDRPSGLVGACARADPPTAQTPALTASERVLLRLGDAYVLDTKGEDRDDPQHMLVTLQLTLSPSDLRPLDFAAAATIETKQLKLKHGPMRDAITRAYPPAALRDGKEGLISVRCQIQTDGSAICGFPEGRTPEETAIFGMAALRALGDDIMFDTRTRDGQPSAGLVFIQKVAFMIEQ